MSKDYLYGGQRSERVYIGLRWQGGSRGVGEESGSKPGKPLTCNNCYSVCAVSLLPVEHISFFWVAMPTVRLVI